MFEKKIYMKTIAHFFALLIFVSSCSYGYNIQEDYQEINYKHTKFLATDFYVFYDGEPIDFRYKKIGKLSITGAKYDEKYDLEKRLIKSARLQGANALVLVKSKRIQRERGYLFSDEDDEIYETYEIEGIAVTIETDSTFCDNYEPINPKLYTANPPSENKNGLGSFFTSVAAVSLVLLIAWVQYEADETP